MPVVGGSKGGTGERAEVAAKKMELAERWRVAGQLLLRLDPKTFEALLAGAEVMVVMTPDPADRGPVSV
jgi:hypothetical protein